MYDVICIGAGPAGLTAAYALSKEGKKVLILESDSKYVGGISRTVNESGYRFDIGGHRFFSKQKEVVNFWREILGDDLLTRSRKSRIYYNKKFFPYPLNIPKTLFNLGAFESVRCFLSYLFAKLLPYRSPKSFREWVTNNFGDRLFQIFFKTYTEKVWGMSCNDISADWAQQRIKGVSFLSAVTSSLRSITGWKSKKVIKSLIEEFQYPRLGPGMFWEETLKHCENFGTEIKFNSQVKFLKRDFSSNTWELTFENDRGEKSTTNATHIISSMPMRDLAIGLDNFPENLKSLASSLRYRDFLTVALVLEECKEIDDNWIYIHDPEVKVGRIQNFKAWSPEMIPNSTDTCFGFEYFCHEGDSLWNSSDSELIELAKAELEVIGLGLKNNVKQGFVVRQQKAYPVYDSQYKATVDNLRFEIASNFPNLHLVGRNGMHKYNNQDHSMMTAMLTAKNIIAGEQLFDPWLVNQDAEYHESGASGERLVPQSKVN